MNNLSLIITFLNEGYEVYRTLECFTNSTDVPFDIILINDGSTDGFNYKEVAEYFKAQYIEHPYRKGAAASRDEGVSLCSTKYFMLIDAHMRVYQDDWVTRIMEILEKDEKLLLCCSTLSLNQNAEICDDTVGYGAFIDLLTLDAKWYHKNSNIKIKDECFDIPCILGASYAGHKSFWQYIKGLYGLKSYGFEEQLISLKTWLSGGCCKVVTTVELGHIFREGDRAPYSVSLSDYYMNQFMVVELFYNDAYKRKYIQEIRKHIDIETINTWIEGKQSANPVY